MLRFEVFQDGQPFHGLDLSGAYVFGQDGIPVRADVVLNENQVSCLKQVTGACGLAVLWQAGKRGRFLLPTTRLPDRPAAYNLNLELLRAQMMRLYQKREDWNLFRPEQAERLHGDFLTCRDGFVRALQAQSEDPAEASRIADETIGLALFLGERMSLFHGDREGRKRIQEGNGQFRFGTRVVLDYESDTYRNALRDGFDFISVPTTWRLLEPKEGEYRYEAIDTWINFAARERKVVHAGPLLSFETDQLPDWLYIWEDDYTALRNLILDRVSRTVQRYRDQVAIWTVVSGLNAVNTFNLNFDQIMELTRTCCTAVRRFVPNARILIELAMPFGEYYARNQRTVPPLLYADMAYQSNIQFDGFALQWHLGVPRDGYFVRDLLQFSAVLDEFRVHEKELHLTACQVPSDVTVDEQDAWGGTLDPTEGGQWHAPWSPRLQAEWLQAIFRIGISKDFIKSICWQDLTDQARHHVPHGGLCDSKLAPKPSMSELRKLRRALQNASAPKVSTEDPT